MKLLVLADTHGEISAAQYLIRAEQPQQVIHLGDCARDAEDLRALFPTLPICAVAGNNDWFCDEAAEKVLRFEGIGIFVCHGHTTRVKQNLSLQWLRAKEHDCRISLFGHTHSPYYEERDGILLCNPGSLTYGDNYAVLFLERGKDPRWQQKQDL